MLKLCLRFLVDILFCVKCMPSKTKHSDSLVLVSEFLVVVILSVSEWWLFCLSDSKFVIRIHCSKEDIPLSKSSVFKCALISLPWKTHCLSYCTMSKMESYYPFTYTYVCTVHPVLLYVPWTRWIYSTMESYCPFTYTYVHYPTVPVGNIPEDVIKEHAK